MSGGYPEGVWMVSDWFLLCILSVPGREVWRVSKILGLKIVLVQKISRPKIISYSNHKFVWTQKNLGPEIFFELTRFLDQKFSGPKFSSNPDFFCPTIFLTNTFFSPKIFISSKKILTQNFFDPHLFYQTFVWVQNFL